MQLTDTVKQLLIITVLFFIGTALLGDFDYTNPAYRLLAMYFPENPNFRFWQPLSHIFMHGSILHLAFNMFALYSFGSALEHFWGAKKFLFFYISCGLGAALLHFAINYYFFTTGMATLIGQGFTETEVFAVLNGQQNNNLIEMLNSSSFSNFISAYVGSVVGASGAIYGLLVAFAFMFPDALLSLMFIPVPVKAKYFVPAMLSIDLYLGLNGGSVFGGNTGVAHFAHIGGALTGFFMMWVWKKNQFNNHRWN